MPATTLRVELLAMTPHAPFVIYTAAKQCQSGLDAYAIYQNAQGTDALYGFPLVSDDEINGLIRRVLASGHDSVVEHVSFTFAVAGVSRALSHQLVRHRIASPSQQSQRHVKAEDFDFILPKAVEESGMGADYIIHMQKVSRLYMRMIKAGIPAEDARFVLPNACETKLVVTMNCRSLLHFFELRCCNRAQWEIRALANAMLEICREKLPVVFENAGARCERLGYCPEDEKFSCGRYPTRQHVGTAARAGGE